MSRPVLLILLFLTAACAHAATLAERSPIRPGLWWNPARSGSGFEIFTRPGEVAAIWYTYERDGSPVWYSAQGALGADGSDELALLRHRWIAGRHAGAAAVGTLRLDIQGNEALIAAWRVDGSEGRWNLTPFLVGGAPPELDRSGVWFDPANPGWGMTFAEQGEVLGATVYTYDDAGEALWFTGSGTPARLALSSFNGSCPSCDYRTPTTRGAASLRLEGDSDTRWTVAAFSSAAPLAPGQAIERAVLQQLSAPASQRRADRQLSSFVDEASLRRYLLPALETESPYWAAINFSPPPPHTVFSATNLQEGAVDEADRVKTDGRFVYTFAESAITGTMQPDVRVLPVGIDGAPAGPVQTFPLTNRETGAYLEEAGLYLDGARLIAVTGTRAGSIGGSPWSDIDAWNGGSTRVEIFDRSNPLAPQSRWFASFDGHLVSSRRIGTRLLLVVRRSIDLPGFIRAPTTTAQRQANQRTLEQTSIEALLPRHAIGYGASVRLHGPEKVFLPPPGGQQQRAQYVSVIAIALDAPRVESALSVIGPVEAVYVSPNHLYLASARFKTADIGLPTFREPPLAITDVHQIAIADSTITLVGSGIVEGHLGRSPDLAPLRFSEHQGRLRVVTSSRNQWGAAPVNRLTILEPSTRVDGLLRTVAYLPNRQRPAPLGKPGEFVYGTRFVDDRLYAVTFRQVDPLYVVDLSDPRDPRIAGEVVLPGFSDYLHPLPGGLLLGVGLDAREAGWATWFLGLQLNLFDVSNPAAPRDLQRVLVGRRGTTSALLRQPHAYSELQPVGANLQLALPARVHDGNIPEYGNGDSATYPWSWSGLLRYELQGSGSAARLVGLPPLVTERAPGTTPYIAQNQALDAAANGARSVLFAQGTLYVAGGRYWYQRGSEAPIGPL
jgi:hypothetical protein